MLPSGSKSRGDGRLGSIYSGCEGATCPGLLRFLFSGRYRLALLDESRDPRQRSRILHAPGKALSLGFVNEALNSVVEVTHRRGFACFKVRAKRRSISGEHGCPFRTSATVAARTPTSCANSRWLNPRRSSSSR